MLATLLLALSPLTSVHPPVHPSIRPSMPRVCAALAVAHRCPLPTRWWPPPTRVSLPGSSCSQLPTRAAATQGTRASERSGQENEARPVFSLVPWFLGFLKFLGFLNFLERVCCVVPPSPFPFGHSVESAPADRQL